MHWIPHREKGTLVMERPLQMAASAISDFYRKSRPTIGTMQDAERGYSQYIHFVQHTLRDCSATSFVLEVGCGVGWSCTFMARTGLADRVIGVDLGATFIERPVSADVAFVQADVFSLPFSTGSFDVVTSYQCLEHLPETERALHEMLRVLRPGGTFIASGPNLLSPLTCVRDLFRFLLANSPAGWFTRKPDELKGPFGNTLPERVGAFARNIVLLIQKAWSSHVEFVPRTPDLRPPAHADTDACYLLNPIDMRKYLSHLGLRILRYQDGGRLRLGRLGALKGGTWVVARKPTVAE